MPILVDFSNVYISAVHAFTSDFKRGESTVKMGQIVRHVTLNSLLGYKNQWGTKCGNLIICCDGRANWRYEVFPYYKGLRKTNREDSDTDWPSIFAILGDFKQELDSIFPYKVLVEDKAEGDDIIFTLADYFAENEFIEEGLYTSPQKVMAISADHDFLQLYKHKNYAQWSTKTKKIIPKPPSTFLVEKIITGDEGDGCPSVLMPDDFLVDKAKYGRAKPVTKKIIEHYSTLSNLTEEELARYRRNEQLISAECVPPEVRDKILEKYKIASDKPDRQAMFEYFVHHKLRQLMPKVTDF